MTNYTYNPPSVTTGLEVFAWINTVTGGWGWSLILLSVFLILILKSRNSIEDSIYSITYLVDIAGIGLALAGLIKIEVIIGLIVFTVALALYKRIGG